MSLKEDLKAEFTKRNALFYDCKPSRMYKSKFGDVAIPMLFIRLVALTFSITVYIQALVLSTTEHNQMIYFTLWSYLILILFFLFSTIVSLIHTFKEVKRRLAKRRAVDDSAVKEEEDVEKVSDCESENTPEQLPWYMQIQWFLYNISMPTSLLVTIIYWGALYVLFPSEVDFRNLMLHAFNVVFMMVEQYVGAIPTRLLHFYQPLGYAMIYAIFTVILFAVDGTTVYPYVLDWTSPGLTMGTVLGIFVFYLLAQLVLFLIYRSLIICLKTKGRGSHL